MDFNSQALPADLQPSPQPLTAPTSVRRLYSQNLLGDHREVVIVHGALEYRLRQTALGKLILTK